MYICVHPYGRAGGCAGRWARLGSVKAEGLSGRQVDPRGGRGTPGKAEPTVGKEALTGFQKISGNLNVYVPFEPCP